MSSPIATCASAMMGRRHPHISIYCFTLIYIVLFNLVSSIESSTRLSHFKINKTERNRKYASELKFIQEKSHFKHQIQDGFNKKYDYTKYRIDPSDSDMNKVTSNGKRILTHSKTQHAGNRVFHMRLNDISKQKRPLPKIQKSKRFPSEQDRQKASKNIAKIKLVLKSRLFGKKKPRFWISDKSTSESVRNKNKQIVRDNIVIHSVKDMNDKMIARVVTTKGQSKEDLNRIVRTFVKHKKRFSTNTEIVDMTKRSNRVEMRRLILKDRTLASFLHFCWMSSSHHCKIIEVLAANTHSPLGTMKRENHVYFQISDNLEDIILTKDDGEDNVNENDDDNNDRNENNGDDIQDDDDYDNERGKLTIVSYEVEINNKMKINVAKITQQLVPSPSSRFPRHNHPSNLLDHIATINRIFFITVSMPGSKLTSPGYSTVKKKSNLVRLRCTKNKNENKFSCKEYFTYGDGMNRHCFCSFLRSLVEMIQRIILFFLKMWLRLVICIMKYIGRLHRFIANIGHVNSSLSDSFWNYETKTKSFKDEIETKQSIENRSSVNTIFSNNYTVTTLRSHDKSNIARMNNPAGRFSARHSYENYSKSIRLYYPAMRRLELDRGNRDIISKSKPLQKTSKTSQHDSKTSRVSSIIFNQHKEHIINDVISSILESNAPPGMHLKSFQNTTFQQSLIDDSHVLKEKQKGKLRSVHHHFGKNTTHAISYRPGKTNYEVMNRTRTNLYIYSIPFEDTDKNQLKEHSLTKRHASKRKFTNSKHHWEDIDSLPYSDAQTLKQRLLLLMKGVHLMNDHSGGSHDLSDLDTLTNSSSSAKELKSKRLKNTHHINRWHHHKVATEADIKMLHNIEMLTRLVLGNEGEFMTGDNKMDDNINVTSNRIQSKTNALSPSSQPDDNLIRQRDHLRKKKKMISRKRVHHYSKRAAKENDVLNDFLDKLIIPEADQIPFAKRWDTMKTRLADLGGKVDKRVKQYTHMSNEIDELLEEGNNLTMNKPLNTDENTIIDVKTKDAKQQKDLNDIERRIELLIDRNHNWEMEALKSEIPEQLYGFKADLAREKNIKRGKSILKGFDFNTNGTKKVSARQELENDTSSFSPSEIEDIGDPNADGRLEDHDSDSVDDGSSYKLVKDGSKSNIPVAYEDRDLIEIDRILDKVLGNERIKRRADDSADTWLSNRVEDILYDYKDYDDTHKYLDEPDSLNNAKKNVRKVNKLKFENGDELLKNEAGVARTKRNKAKTYFGHKSRYDRPMYPGVQPVINISTDNDADIDVTFTNKKDESNLHHDNMPLSMNSESDVSNQTGKSKTENKNGTNNIKSNNTSNAATNVTTENDLLDIPIPKEEIYGGKLQEAVDEATSDLSTMINAKNETKNTNNPALDRDVDKTMDLLLKNISRDIDDELKWLRKLETEERSLENEVIEDAKKDLHARREEEKKWNTQEKEYDEENNKIKIKNEKEEIETEEHIMQNASKDGEGSDEQRHNST